MQRSREAEAARRGEQKIIEEHAYDAFRKREQAAQDERFAVGLREDLRALGAFKTVPTHRMTSGDLSRVAQSATDFHALSEHIAKEQCIALGDAGVRAEQLRPDLAEAAGYKRPVPLPPIGVEYQHAIETALDALCGRPGEHRLRTDPIMIHEAKAHVARTRPDVLSRYREETQHVPQRHDPLNGAPLR